MDNDNIPEKLTKAQASWLESTVSLELANLAALFGLMQESSCESHNGNYSMAMVGDMGSLLVETIQDRILKRSGAI